MEESVAKCCSENANGPHIQFQTRRCYASIRSLVLPRLPFIPIVFIQKVLFVLIFCIIFCSINILNNS